MNSDLSGPAGDPVDHSLAWTGEFMAMYSKRMTDAQWRFESSVPSCRQPESLADFLDIYGSTLVAVLYARSMLAGRRSDR